MTTADSGRIAREAARRRTFAIISHPDAGKTTLTEKLLLYAGAVHEAGSVTARGGRGIAVRVDHTVDAEVAALFARVMDEQGRLDVVVNDISGGDIPFVPFWDVPTAKGLEVIMGGLVAHPGRRDRRPGP